MKKPEDFLSGKALNIFNSEKGSLEWEVDRIYLTSIIIAFFDSIGVYIDTPPIIGEYGNVVFGSLVNRVIVYNDKTQHKAFVSRQDAIEAAIIASNEFFNNQHPK